MMPETAGDSPHPKVRAADAYPRYTERGMADLDSVPTLDLLDAVRQRMERQPVGTAPPDFNPNLWIGWAYRHGRVLAAVADAGGRMTNDEFRELCADLKYKMQGVSGWSTGKNPVLVRDGTDWVITALGERDASEFRDFFPDG